MNVSKRVLANVDEAIDPVGGKVFVTGKSALKPAELVVDAIVVGRAVASNGLFFPGPEKYTWERRKGYGGYYTPNPTGYLRLSPAFALVARPAKQQTSKTVRSQYLG